MQSNVAGDSNLVGALGTSEILRRDITPKWLEALTNHKMAAGGITKSQEFASQTSFYDGGSCFHMDAPSKHKGDAFGSLLKHFLFQ